MFHESKRDPDAVNKKGVVYLPVDGTALSATYLSVFDDGNRIKISWIVSELRCGKNEKVRRTGEAHRISVLLNLDKRTTTLMQYVMSNADKVELAPHLSSFSTEKPLNKKKFRNITQTMWDDRRSQLRKPCLFFPPELMKYLGKRLNPEDPKCLAKGSTISEIAWMNRIRGSAEEIRIAKSWAQVLISGFLEKGTMYKRYTRMLRKSPTFSMKDRKTLLEARLASPIDGKVRQVRPALYDALWKNPKGIEQLDNVFFGFQDLNFQARALEVCNGTSFLRSVRNPEKHTWNYDRDQMISVWRSEKRALDKYIACKGDGGLFRDITNMIDQINDYNDDRVNGWMEGDRADPPPSQIRISTKGNMVELHDRLYRELDRIGREDKPIPLKFEDTSFFFQEKEYGIHFPTHTHELIDVGITLHNCVGSYGERAVRGDCLIFVVTRNGKLHLCCEVSQGRLWQCMLDSNQPAPGSLQKALITVTNRLGVTREKEDLLLKRIIDPYEF